MLSWLNGYNPILLPFCFSSNSFKGYQVWIVEFWETPITVQVKMIFFFFNCLKTLNIFIGDNRFLWYPLKKHVLKQKEQEEKIKKKFMVTVSSKLKENGDQSSFISLTDKTGWLCLIQEGKFNFIQKIFCYIKIEQKSLQFWTNPFCTCFLVFWFITRSQFNCKWFHQMLLND